MRAFEVRDCVGKFCENSRLNCVGPIVVFLFGREGLALSSTPK
jgi:hypothetical protein